jgi:V/A-type H+-transporting ATPase subunit D
VIDTAQAPTQAALLALKEERAVIDEAYEFLDEKRLLLAAELLRQLTRYESLNNELGTLTQQAAGQLKAAVQRHGLQELGVYPARLQGRQTLEKRQKNFMGVTLIETRLDIAATPVVVKPCFASDEADLCRSAFEQLVVKNAELSGVVGNLYRLMVEYRMTERRARALENIILPEVEQAFKEIGTHLEEMEFEDAIRVRRQVTSR